MLADCRDDDCPPSRAWLAGLAADAGARSVAACLGEADTRGEALRTGLGEEARGELLTLSGALCTASAGATAFAGGGWKAAAVGSGRAGLGGGAAAAGFGGGGSAVVGLGAVTGVPGTAFSLLLLLLPAAADVALATADAPMPLAEPADAAGGFGGEAARRASFGSSLIVGGGLRAESRDEFLGETPRTPTFGEEAAATLWP